jgi:hypothetical protein
VHHHDRRLLFDLEMDFAGLYYSWRRIADRIDDAGRIDYSFK